MAEDESGSYTDGDDDEEDVPAGPPNADGAALAAPKAAPASLLPAGNPGDERRCERGSGSEKSQSRQRARAAVAVVAQRGVLGSEPRAWRRQPLFPRHRLLSAGRERGSRKAARPDATVSIVGIPWGSMRALWSNINTGT